MYSGADGMYMYGDAERHTLYTLRETATIVCGRLVTLCSLSLSLFFPFFLLRFSSSAQFTQRAAHYYICVYYII